MTRTRPGTAFRSSRHFHWPAVVTISLAALMTLLLVVPFFALVWRSLTLKGAYLDAWDPIALAVVISLGTTGVSAVLILLLGTPMAYLLARQQFPFKRFISLFVEMPIVMPPVVAGLALLSTYGRQGILGDLLNRLDINVTFSTTAVVLAQVFVASPFFIRAAQSRFESLPREYEYAASVDGADRWQLFWHIMLPLSARAMLGGLLLSWARALGEFGATILFAGNLTGRTQTMPLLVYSVLERDLKAAFVTSLILLGLAFLAFAMTRWLARLDEENDDRQVSSS